MVYVLTDLHGRYDLWEQIKNWLKEEDQLIYLGDAIDRGDRGFELFMELLDDPHVIYVLGNHEDLMYCAMTLKAEQWRNKYYKAWMQNGGHSTLQNMHKLIQSGKITYEKALEYINRISDMPYYVMVPLGDTGVTFYLTHAGFTPSDELKQMDEFEQEHLLTWDRKHLGDTWPAADKYKKIYIIHGHTPKQFLKQYGANYQEIDGMLWYAGGHKLCLDTGCVSTGEVPLLCLDTLSIAKVFKADKVID